MSSYTGTTHINRSQSRQAEAAAKERTALWTWVVVLVLLGPLLTAGYFFIKMRGQAIGHAVPDRDAARKGAPPRKEIRSGTKTPVQARIPAGGAADSDLHGTYLQLGAGANPEELLERLRNKGFPAASVEIPERPGLFRVLVGPVPGDSVAETRARLDSQGLNGKSAIPRVF